MQRENSSSNSSLVCFITPVWPVSKLHEKLFAICVGILSPLTVASNYLLILALRKTHQLNTYSNKFIQVMSCCDLTTGLIFQPALIVMLLMKASKTICYSISIINLGISILFQISCLLSVLISIGRYLQITKLSRYDIYMNEKRTRASIGLCFVLGLFLVCLFILYESLVTRTLIVLANISMLWFMFVMYCFILHKLQKHIKKGDNISAKAGENASIASNQIRIDPRHNSRSHLSAIKTLRALQMAILALYSPYVVLSIMLNFYSLHLRVPPSRRLIEAFNWSQILLECNAWVNAWILIHGNRRCRRFLLSWIRSSARSFWSPNSVTALADVQKRQAKPEETET